MNMGNCKKHPNRTTSFKCEKYETYLCRECLACKDPKLYCKYRPSCPVYFITEKKIENEE